MKQFLTKIGSVLLASLMLAAFCPIAVAEEAEGDLAASLDAFIAEHESTTAGLAVAVFGESVVQYEKYVGYADIENGLPVTEETVFEWGSVTKLLVWVSVMQLWEQGLLDLDADIRTYLPDGFLTNLHYETPVTMLHLMNHRAGFQEMLSDIMLPVDEPVLPLGEALQQHEPAQVYEPDTVTAYSSFGTALAGYTVECISGESFCDYVHAHIFQPLNMTHTALLPDLSDNAWVRAQRDLLQCYTIDAKLIPNCRYQIPLYPCGMCTGTLSDLLTFGQALLNENSPLFQRDDTHTTLFTPSGYYPGTDFPRNCHGFLVSFFADPVVGHDGNSVGNSANLLLNFESGRGVAVMTNQQYESVFNDDLPKLVFGTYAGSDCTLPKGIYRTSRTILEGPFKWYSVSGYSVYSADDLNWFWQPDKENDAVIHWQSSDSFRLPVTTLILEWGLLLLLAAAALFSLIYLTACPIGALTRRIRKSAPKKDARRPLRCIASALQLLLIGLIAYVVIQDIRWAPSRTYRWCFAAAGVIGLLMLALIVWLLFRRGAKTKSARTLNVLSIAFLVSSALNILYWQIFAFWAL